MTTILFDIFAANGNLVLKEEVVKDANGNPTSVRSTHYDEQGNADGITDRDITWDAQGKYTGQTVTRRDGRGNAKETRVIEFEQDPGGRSEREKTTTYRGDGTQPGDFVESEETVRHYEKGRLRRRSTTRLSKSGDPLEAEEEEYDATGRLLRRTRTGFTNGRKRSFVSDTYDRNGTLRRHDKMQYDEQGRPVCGVEEEYDEQGRLLRRIYSDYEDDPRHPRTYVEELDATWGFLRSRRLCRSPQGEPLFAMELAGAPGGDVLSSGELCFQSAKGRPTWTVRVTSREARRVQRPKRR